MKKQKKQTYSQEVAEAKKAPYSLGYKFMKELKGLNCFYKNRPVDKWELWAHGYRDAAKIKAGVIPEIKTLKKIK